MGSLRTAETETAYQKVKDEGGLEGNCRLCRAPSLREYEQWRVIDNDFPYDRIAKVHHMIIPKRHAKEPELTAEEKEEFDRIKESYLLDTYEYLIEASRLKRSIPAHAHLHLLISKD